MKNRDLLKTIIGVPIALWLTVRVYISWEVLTATLSSVLYITSRFFMFVVVGIFARVLHRVVSIIKKEKEK